MVLIIDNYGSFTYNIYQLIGEVNTDIEIFRNDEITIKEIELKNPTHIFLSSGPGYPKDTGICIEAIINLYKKYPILGICLGHQAIFEAFGGKIINAENIVYGKKTPIHLANGNPIFKGLPPVTDMGRYNSLIGDKRTISDCLNIIAEDEAGEIMGVQHKTSPTFGVQFHPESILSIHGHKVIKNFLEVDINDYKCNI